MRGNQPVLARIAAGRGAAAALQTELHRQRRSCRQQPAIVRGISRAFENGDGNMRRAWSGNRGESCEETSRSSLESQLDGGGRSFFFFANGSLHHEGTCAHVSPENVLVAAALTTLFCASQLLTVDNRMPPKSQRMKTHIPVKRAQYPPDILCFPPTGKSTTVYTLALSVP